MHMEQAQWDQAKEFKAIKHGFKKKRTITINSDHNDHSHKE